MKALTYECVRVCVCARACVQVDACVLSIYNFIVKTLHVIVRDFKNPTVLSPCLSLPPCGQHNVRHFVSNNTHYWPQLYCHCYTNDSVYLFCSFVCFLKFDYSFSHVWHTLSFSIFKCFFVVYFVFVNQSTAIQIILWHFSIMIREIIVSYDRLLLIIWLDLH